MPVEQWEDSARASRDVRNGLLLGIPEGECASLLKKLEFIDMPRATVLNEAGQPIKYAFFINSGLASVLNVMNDGNVIEVGLCGAEGFVGLPLLAGLKTSAMRPTLVKSLARFGQEMMLQAMQVGACNRLHTVEQRLAKWLLLSQDRLGGTFVPLTQDFLSHMLGTRRANVTVGASELQRRGAISYHRGKLQIQNRRTLEAASCECYSTLVDQFAAWEAEAK
jgi:CRP-like cAMP-binding protein